MNEFDNLKFGDLVKVQSHRLVIDEEKLKELKEKYGTCLSNRQMNDISSENFMNDVDSDFLDIQYTDLEIKETRESIYLIIQRNSFGYRGSYYSEHYKYDNYFNGYDHIQKVADEPMITLDKIGKDFEDFSVWAKPQIIKVITGKERKKLLSSEFFSSLK